MIATLKESLDLSDADQTEILVYAERLGLTRFANSIIHQNLIRRSHILNTRVIYGQSIGTARSTKLDKKTIKRQLALARESSRHSEDPDFVSLPREQDGYTKLKNYSRKTENCTPEERAEWVRTIVQLAERENLKLAGRFTTGSTSLAVVNSLGIEASTRLTEAELAITAIGEDSTGYAEAQGYDVGRIDAEKTARIAIEKALRSANPHDLGSGKYTVVLEPLAVSDLLRQLSFLSFGALAYHEKRSYLSGKLGEKVASEHVTIYDDAYDLRSIGFPFDFEGVAKKRVPLVEDGIARGVAYDSYTANRYDEENTGHALPPPNPYGPFPVNLVMEAGRTPKDDLIRSTKKGLLVTRFWYVRTISPKETLVTGTTRDGTFLIEDGEVTRPVKNLRFQESILGALSRVEVLGRETESHAVVAPWAKIRDFNFIGGTEY